MALLKRQITYVVFDDQGPGLWGNYVGNWAHHINQGFSNYTYTATPTPGASLSLTFSGSQAWVYGGALGNTANGYPSANYLIDGVSSGPQTPFIYSGQLVSFQTPKLPDGIHKIDITVTTANDTNLYILDYITILPSAGVYSSGSGFETTTMAPSSVQTSPNEVLQSALVNAVVGSVVGIVVGGIASIVILIIPVYHFLSRTVRDKLADYFRKRRVEHAGRSNSPTILRSPIRTGSPRSPTGTRVFYGSRAPSPTPTVRPITVSRTPSQHTRLSSISSPRRPRTPETPPRSYVVVQDRGMGSPVEYTESPVEYMESPLVDHQQIYTPTDLPNSGISVLSAD